MNKTYKVDNNIDTSRQKAKNNSTNYIHSCLKRLVLFSKSFYFFLGQLLSFYLLLVAARFTIQNHVS